MEICSGCIGRSVESPQGTLAMARKDFLEAVLAELRLRRPDIDWSLTTTSCMRVCPPQRLSLVVAGRMGMSRQTSAVEVARDILARVPA